MIRLEEHADINDLLEQFNELVKPAYRFRCDELFLVWLVCNLQKGNLQSPRGYVTLSSTMTVSGDLEVLNF